MLTVFRAFSGVRLEHPDTNEGKALSAFCRKFTAPLERGLKAAGIRIDAPAAPLLHLFLTDSRQALLKRAEGDEVVVTTPKGRLRYTIVAISYGGVPAPGDAEGEE